MISFFGYKIKQKDRKNNLSSSSFKLSNFINQIISTKKIHSENLDIFLDPKIKTTIPNPSIINNMNQGIEKVIEVLKKKDCRICIFGDYDVDGSCSSALLKIFFNSINIKSDIFIPNRIEDGYGLSLNALSKIDLHKYDLMISVDCGTNSISEFEYLKSKNIPLIVLDHHKSSVNQDYAIIINPNHINDNSHLNYLCAAGVVFLFLVKLKTEYAKNIDQNIEIDLFSLIPIVALGTVCDVMDLVGFNRSLVKKGIELINETENFGLQKLIQVAKIEKISSAYHFGFILGPMINAGGRIAKSDLGATLLSTEDKKKAESIAEDLFFINQERIVMEKEILNNIDEGQPKILKQIDDFGFIFQFSDNWHEGLIGIIASRLKDKYYRPSFVGNLKDNIIKCSVRSIVNIDIGNLILEAVEKKILLKGGGHKSAGGLSLQIEKLDDFMIFMKEKMKNVSDYENKNKTIEYDCEIPLAFINKVLCEELKILEPFGNGNPKPLFLIQNLKVIKYEILKEKHLKLLLSDGKNSSFGMLFNLKDFDILKELNRKISILCNIDSSNFNGKEYINLIILDLLLI